jgi:hypothetical protein
MKLKSAKNSCGFNFLQIFLRILVSGTKIKKFSTYKNKFARKKNAGTETKKLRTHRNENDI